MSEFTQIKQVDMFADEQRALLNTAPLKILIADDTLVNRQILQVFLERLGFICLMAEDGEQAIKACEADMPDIVLMDVMMPVINGYDATRRIRELAGDRWVPVLFLSALDRDESLIDGLEAGGDDFMSKPFNFIVLDAKIRSLRRTVEYQRRLHENALRLGRYHEQQELQNRFAHEIFERQLQRPGLSLPNVQYWIASADGFSGDIVAAEKSPDGRLYAMLADGTGHGLAAAISVIPILSLFYLLVSMGRSLSDLVAELNTHMRATLPSGRFVALSVVCLDAGSGKAEVWVGGMPDLLWVDQSGALRQRFPSTHLPMGVTDSDSDLCSVVEIEMAPNDRFIFYSDGLIEAETSQGEPLGCNNLIEIVASSTGEKPLLEHIQDETIRFVGSGKPHDDISVLIVARN